MPEQNRVVRPGRTAGTVLTESGEVLTPPTSWDLLPPGDAAVTRRVKDLGPVWLVQVKKGRRLMSQGIWAEASHILQARQEIEKKRETPEYNRRRELDIRRRGQRHEAYVEEFYLETLRYLAFHPRYRELAEQLARRVTAQTTPVGSGTVARTERIELPERVQAAVIAWLRHQTTAYDSLRIARVRGRRREVRRQLAAESLSILERYRQGDICLDAACPLQAALERRDQTE